MTLDDFCALKRAEPRTDLQELNQFEVASWQYQQTHPADYGLTDRPLGWWVKELDAWRALVQHYPGALQRTQRH